MDPYTEQRLRDEVMYLHSLWHQGPPINPNPNPNCSYSIHNRSNSNQMNGHTQLKPIKKKMKNSKKKKMENKSDYEWPCNEIVQQPLSSSGWPVFNPVKTKSVPVATTGKQNHLNALYLQQNALKVSREFFTKNDDSDEDIDSDDDDDEMMDEDENAQYNFFAKVFEEDGELKGYYEKKNENGEFSCLVCGGIGEKVGKKFKDCVALVQHSVTIAKTKKKKAHRAYAHVICNVLGWDIKKLPSMPLPDKQPDESKEKAEVASNTLTNYDKDTALNSVGIKDSDDVNDDEKLPSSMLSETSTEDIVMPCQGNLDVSIRNISISNTDMVLNNDDNDKLNLNYHDIDQFLDVHNCVIPDITDNVNGDMMLCEVDDANKCVENIENGVSYAGGNSSGVVNNLSRNVEKMTVLDAK